MKLNHIFDKILREYEDVKGIESKYPVAGNKVDGLDILDDIPNTKSISSSLIDYYVLEDVREVPIKEFDAKPKDLFYAKDDIDQVRELAREIRENGEIKPLIVVIDNKGPYVLEGVHRLGALYLIGVKKIPALIVVDVD